jgi:hypothetical protein
MNKTITGLIVIIVIIFSTGMFVDYVEYINNAPQYPLLPTPPPTHIKEPENTLIGDYDHDGIPNCKDTHPKIHEELYQYASDYGLSGEVIRELASLKPNLYDGHRTDDFKEYMNLLGEVKFIQKKLLIMKFQNILI